MLIFFNLDHAVENLDREVEIGFKVYFWVLYNINAFIIFCSLTRRFLSWQLRGVPQWRAVYWLWSGCSSFLKVLLPDRNRWITALVALIIVIHFDPFDVILAEVEACLGHLIKFTDFRPGYGLWYRLWHRVLWVGDGSVTMLYRSETIWALADSLIWGLGLYENFLLHVCAVQGSSFVLTLSLLGLIARLSISGIRPDYFLADVWRQRVILERLTWISLLNDRQPSLNVTWSWSQMKNLSISMACCSIIAHQLLSLEFASNLLSLKICHGLYHIISFCLRAFSIDTRPLGLKSGARSKSRTSFYAILLFYLIQILRAFWPSLTLNWNGIVLRWYRLICRKFWVLDWGFPSINFKRVRGSLLFLLLPCNFALNF